MRAASVSSINDSDSMTWAQSTVRAGGAPPDMSMSKRPLHHHQFHDQPHWKREREKEKERRKWCSLLEPVRSLLSFVLDEILRLWLARRAINCHVCWSGQSVKRGRPCPHSVRHLPRYETTRWWRRREMIWSQFFAIYRSWSSREIMVQSWAGSDVGRFKEWGAQPGPDGAGPSLLLPIDLTSPTGSGPDHGTRHWNAKC